MKNSEYSTHQGLWIKLSCTLLSLLLLALILLVWMGGKDRTEKQGQSQLKNTQNSTQPQPSPSPSLTAAASPDPNSSEGARHYFALQESPEDASRIAQYFGPLPSVQPGAQKAPHVPSRAIYIAQADNLENDLALIKDTEVNAVVLDAKESYGLTYQSRVPLAQELGASVGQLDIPAIVRRCHENQVRVIARMVCFKDEILAAKRPDWLIQDREGRVLQFPLEANHSFVSPYKKEAWDYLIAIARELKDFGVDEIQFDYVRFPSGEAAGDSEPYFGEAEQTPERYQAINRFLQTASLELEWNSGISLSADIFAISMTSDIDGKSIGQFWEKVGLTGLNALCPMIYPSHYSNASNGTMGNGEGMELGGRLFTAPDMEAYGVIEAVMRESAPKNAQEGFAQLRPYLQAFTASYLPEGYYQHYGAQQIREQIRALAEHGCKEWVLWGDSSQLTKDSLVAEAGN